MAARFRLLDLNEVCVNTVIQCFDHFDLITFSLCSKKRLANVRSLKLPIRKLKLVCGNTFHARLIFKGNYMQLFFCEDGYDRLLDQRDNRPRRLQVNYIEGCNRERIHRWRKANFRDNDWLRHFMDVFNCDFICSMVVFESKFEIDSLVDIVRNLNIAKFSTFQNIPKHYTLSFLRAQPCVEILDVKSLTFDEPSEYSILLRNQQNLTFRTGDKITLDIVLSVNSLTLNCSELSIKDVNRFIKLWQKGANPRLKHLLARFIASGANVPVFNENYVLRGVQYQRIPQGTVRMFEMPAGRRVNGVEVNEGFDIIGKNGRKATVHLENDLPFLYFRMYVWQ